ncbi:MAG: penicillin-binding transpeptidase domain-containing protein [Burkholderiales bacterium]|nr:penicillin-binding transpeptidase domain-containing protein [Burkholderiales bacterium]
MIRRIFRKQKIRNANSFVEPDEIFLDSQNLQNFDRQQFEGRIEKPISKKNIIAVGLLFVLFLGIFYSRLGYLQIKKGEAYLERSQNNTLEKQIIFSDRGIIYDRNKVELAWNKKETNLPTTIRTYLSPGFSHILGYVSYPMKDKTGNYWQSVFIGKDGLEKQYNDKLKGENGSKIVEIDVHNKIHSENIVNAPKRGADLVTTIDSRIQKELYTLIKNLSQSNSFSGGSGVLIDINNGEIISSVSYPEYDSEVLSLGKDVKKIQGYFNDKRKVFLDKTISGLYTPGSIVKPFFAVGALTEKIIDPSKKILSTGSISIPNPYFPGQNTVFKDWKAHGWTDMRESIAVSSDVYFYAIGGGYADQKGLGIANIEKYARLFGIGTKTGIDIPDEKEGVIPSPAWKLKNFKGEPWRIGDTYHTAIGQYGFQVTPMEMTRAVSALANYGTLINPHYILGDTEKEKNVSKINLEKAYIQVAHEGMRQSVLSGTSSPLNVSYVKVAAKTGTAQVGISKSRVNSWIIGFFPYENPKYAFTIMMESGPSSNGVGASSIMRQLLDWMSINTPQYFK